MDMTVSYYSNAATVPHFASFFSITVVGVVRMSQFLRPPAGGSLAWIHPQLFFVPLDAIVRWYCPHDYGVVVNEIIVIVKNCDY